MYTYAHSHMHHGTDSYMYNQGWLNACMQKAIDVHKDTQSTQACILRTLVVYIAKRYTYVSTDAQRPSSTRFVANTTFIQAAHALYARRDWKGEICIHPHKWRHTHAQIHTQTRDSRISKLYQLHFRHIVACYAHAHNTLICIYVCTYVCTNTCTHTHTHTHTHKHTHARTHARTHTCAHQLLDRYTWEWRHLSKHLQL